MVTTGSPLTCLEGRPSKVRDLPAEMEVTKVKCPVDDTTLLMGERHGVEIDYCPECRGVWLDRGELDAIIERSGADGSSPDHQARRDDSGDRDRYKQHERREDAGGRRKGRFSMLADLIGGGEE